MSAVQALYINEDNLIRWDRVRLASSGSYVSSGTFTWALKNEAGTSLATGTLSYVASSSGRWQGVIDKLDVDDLTEGETYYLEITATNGSGADGFRRVQLVARYHGGDL